MRTPAEGFRVRLKRDMTRWHPALHEGAEGKTLPPAGRSAIDQDRYLKVEFAETRYGVIDPPLSIDVLYHDLDVIDERWVAWQESEAAAKKDALEKHVKKATLYTTPRGGFVELVVEYSSGRPSDRWKRRSECREILERLNWRQLLETVVRKG